MKHRITTTVFALAAALTFGACSGGGEQGMQDSAAGQTGAGTGTTPAGGPNTNDTSAARAGGTAGTGTAGDTTRRDTTRAGTGTPRTTP